MAENTTCAEARQYADRDGVKLTLAIRKDLHLAIKIRAVETGVSIEDLCIAMLLDGCKIRAIGQ